MNKHEYLCELEKELKSAGVRDCADIIEEYAEHFDLKAADGFGEEEIAARLAPPAEIAGQYKEIGAKSCGGTGPVAARIMKTIGVIFTDIIVAPIMIILYAWVFTLGVFSLSSLIVGGSLAAWVGQFTQDNPYIHIPPMPYICSLLLGISLLALAVLAAVGTEYCRLYVSQMLRKYARWHKNVLGKGHISPPLPLHPWITPKKRRIMRGITLIMVVIFAVAFVAGLGSMIILSGSLEPWHVWGWFR